MDEIFWLRSRIGTNEDFLWTARHTSRELLDFRASFAGHWDDTAARQVRDRFLVPHEEDEAECLARLAEQIESLTGALYELERLHEAASAADRLSEQIDSLLAEARVHLGRAHASLDRTADAVSRSVAAASHAESLVSQADSFGF
jgi:hypothetical protein